MTEVQAPKWLANTDLRTDDLGFVSVNRQLQSVSHENVFAAGDVADLRGQPRAKSGVYAVRAGPHLARNLRRHLLGQPLKHFKAQRHHLALIGCGDGTAIASRQGRGFSGPTIGLMLWRLKDFIDRRFMDNFNKLPVMTPAQDQLHKHLQVDAPEVGMRCGGCGAKLAADPLRRVLARLPKQDSAQITLGIGDDAAQIMNPAESTLVSVDGFRAMVSDPYLFGRVAAHHSLNDLFAMACQPTAALAYVTLPLMREALMEEELFQLLSGCTAVLNEHDVPLVGGHSAEGLELNIGLTVIGASDESPLRKSNAQVSDCLVMTKPLGTGAILAACMQGTAPTDVLETCLRGMDSSNAAVVKVLVEHGASALTDITGFGLLGHLGEMLRASQVGVDIWVDQVLFYPGADTCIESSPSSLQSANELALLDFELSQGLTLRDAEIRLLVDPQTAGGMLAAIPELHLQACLDKLAEIGHPSSHFGNIEAPGNWRIRSSGC